MNFLHNYDNDAYLYNYDNDAKGYVLIGGITCEIAINLSESFSCFQSNVMYLVLLLASAFLQLVSGKSLPFAYTLYLPH